MVLEEPLSHSSLPVTWPSPQPVQSVEQLNLVSPLLHTPSPQNGPTTVLVVQLVVQVEQENGGL